MPPAESHTALDDSPFRLLVTAGGGGWPTTQGFLDAVCDGLKPLLAAHEDISAEIVTGPLFSGTVEELPRTKVHRYLENREMLRSMGRSTLAVAQAGYNTCNDLIASQLPAILIPAPREIESQEERAKYFEDKGCAQVVEQKDTAIRIAIEQFYKDRSLLLNMRKACSKAVSSSGTPVIAERILLFAPTITYMGLNASDSIEPADFIVAQGSPEDEAYECLSAMREKTQFVLLRGGTEWFSSSTEVARLIGCVDAVQFPLSSEHHNSLALGSVPEDLAAALNHLNESYLLFEVRVDISQESVGTMQAVVERLVSLGCPQVHISLSKEISDGAIDGPLAELRKNLIDDEGVRIYCSCLELVPSQFSRERTLYRLHYQRTRFNSEFLALEIEEDVVTWKERFNFKMQSMHPLHLIDNRIRLLKQRHPYLTLAMAGDVSALDTEDELWELWFAAQKKLKVLEQNISRTKRVRLGDVTQELDDVILKQENFKQGKSSGETWRSLERQRNELTLHYNSVWNTHVKPLDEDYQHLYLNERQLAKPLYALLVSRRKKKYLAWKQEYLALTETPSVKRYVFLGSEIQQLDKRIDTLSREIEQGQAEKTI